MDEGHSTLDPYSIDFRQSNAGDRHKRYRYADRGDGMYEQARQLGGRPHLVLSGKYVSIVAAHCCLADSARTGEDQLYGVSYCNTSERRSCCTAGMQAGQTSSMLADMLAHSTTTSGSRVRIACYQEASVLVSEARGHQYFTQQLTSMHYAARQVPNLTGSATLSVVGACQCHYHVSDQSLPLSPLRCTRAPRRLLRRLADIARGKPLLLRNP